jgi:hypothetical protein
MKPSFPVDITHDTQLVALTNEIECSMLRLGQPCRNTTDMAVICRVEYGYTAIVGVCEMCIGEMPEAWRAALDPANKEY